MKFLQKHVVEKSVFKDVSDNILPDKVLVQKLAAIGGYAYPLHEGVHCYYFTIDNGSRMVVEWYYAGA